MAANHVDEDLDLPGPERTAIQIAAEQFFHQPVKLRQDRIVVWFEDICATCHGVSMGACRFANISKLMRMIYSNLS